MSQNGALPVSIRSQEPVGPSGGAIVKSFPDKWIRVTCRLARKVLSLAGRDREEITMDDSKGIQIPIRRIPELIAMKEKSARKKTRPVRALEMKTLARDRARLIKGGPCPGTNTRAVRLESF
jgi:hypothetical protein